MTLLKKSIMKDITRTNLIVLNKHYKTQVNVRERWVAHHLLVLPKNQEKRVKNQRKRGVNVAEHARDEDINKYSYEEQ
jgi:hypothetical protein